jgi:hypothetical protein
MKLFKGSVVIHLISVLLLGILTSSCALFSQNSDPHLTETSIIEVPSDAKDDGKQIADKPLSKTKKDQTRPTTKDNSPIIEGGGSHSIAIQQEPKKNPESIKQIVALPKSTVEIHGDSTMRKYVSRATKIGVKVIVTPPIGELKNLLKEKVSEFILLIPVASLKSGTELLDEHLLDAIKAKEFPEIRGVLKSYKIDGKQDLNKTKVLASVELTIAGVTKLVSVEAIVSLEEKTVRVHGEKQILMSEFNITAPTMMLGAITTSDAVTIKYDFYLELK